MLMSSTPGLKLKALSVAFHRMLLSLCSKNPCDLSGVHMKFSLDLCI